MSQYVHFAAVYDKWMQNIDYAQWWQYLATTFSLRPGMHILEAGCGTGNLTQHMLQAGFNVTATDISGEMLTQADSKLRGLRNYRLLQLDMRRLPQSLGQFDAVVAACDVVNYLRSTDDVTRFISSARSVLRKDGVLLFDVHGKGRISDWLNNPYYNRAGQNSCYLLHVSVENARITQRLTGFLRSEHDMWQRFDEVHRQHFYDYSFLTQLLNENGFGRALALEFNSTEQANASSQRIQFAARQ